MKSVKGEVLSTTPITVSKAAKILSKFVSTDSGASQAVCAYLRRASVSFNELNQLHKDLKSDRKRKTRKLETGTKPDGEECERKKHKKRGGSSNSVKSEVESVEDKVRIQVEESDLAVKAEKKKNRGHVGNLEEAECTVKIEEDGNVDSGGKEHNKTKRENGGKIGYFEEQKNRIKNEEDANLGMENDRKKHKRRKTSEPQVGNVKEDGEEIEVKQEGEEKMKKRKSREIDERKETNSEGSQSNKKKKKQKIEGES